MLNLSVICGSGVAVDAYVHVCLLLWLSGLVAFTIRWLRRTCSAHAFIQRSYFWFTLRTEEGLPPMAPLLHGASPGGGTGPPGEGSLARLKQGKWHWVGAGAGAGGVRRRGGSQGGNA